MTFRGEKIDFGKDLNDEQLDVVLHGDGPCLVLAGAGSGKTRTVTYRVVYLLEQGIAPENILLLTFTNKAAKEMLGRVDHLLGGFSCGLLGGTFHSVANRILRKYADKVGYTPNFSILDEEDSKSLVKACVKASGVDTSSRRFPSPSNIHSLASYSRNSGLSIAQAVDLRFPTMRANLPMIEKIIELYEIRKRESDSLDFDDLLLKLRELLYSNDCVRQCLANQYKYILVDEYQDTNVIQADIVRQLASVHKNILVVGDDAQSIYSFRAAEIRNILNFPQEYPGARVFRLTTNYRSTPEILAVANASIQANKDQFKKKLNAVRKSQKRPNLTPSPNALHEAKYIAKKIIELHDSGIALNEIAVLFRAAFHSQALEFEMMKCGIPYEYRGGMKFFERAHIKDIVAYLRVRANQKDETAWLRVLGLLNGIGLATAEDLTRQITGIGSLRETLDVQINVPSRALTGWETFKHTLEKLAQEESPSAMIRAVIALDYSDYLQAEYPDFADRLEDLEQFAVFAEDYSDLKSFLDEVSLSNEYGGISAARGGVEKVVLSTVHQAKGLEWDAVFVMHLADGKFPNERAISEDGGLQEERRLFYVATTRARKYLYFSYPMTNTHDSFALCGPSAFLSELPKELLESAPAKHAGINYLLSDDEEPTIVLDKHGERLSSAPLRKNFLREV